MFAALCMHFSCIQVFDTSDLPGGVVNIVTGSRDHLTKFLTEHQDVEAMWWEVVVKGECNVCKDVISECDVWTWGDCQAKIIRHFDCQSNCLMILVPGLIYYSTRKSLGMRLESLLLTSLFIQLSVCEAPSVLVGRYFGSAEGSKFVEMASVDNVKRTWVNYGGTREWSDPTQGQVGGRGGCDCNMCVWVHEKSWLLKAVDRMASSKKHPSHIFHRVRSFSTMLPR